MLVLEIWHMVVLSFLFGFCYLYSTKRGQMIGAENAIITLLERRIIDITISGDIIPYDKNNNGPFLKK